MSKRIVFIIAAFLMLNITFLSAQDIVNNQIDNITKQLLKQGYEETHDVFFESLDNGKYAYYSVDLEAGVEYQIVAVCDEDCGDIDMCIFDGNANELDCDKTDDDIPILIFTATKTGEHSIWVKMYDCTINPCKFGIAIFGK